MPSGMTRDEIRTVGLLFGEELALGIVEPDALRVPEVMRTVRAQPVPSTLSRRLQVRQLRAGRLDGIEHSMGPRMAARRAVLGDAALGRPKLLLRVPGFPELGAWDEATAGVARAATRHAIFRAAGVPYLQPVVPRVAEQPLDPQVAEAREHVGVERELLGDQRRDGVAFAVHGLDHRTRDARPARRAEFTGRRRAEPDERLDAALEAMHGAALHADVVVPPWERFDAMWWPALADRFDVVCGGPASVARFGFHPSPIWRGDAVWLPSYAPLVGTARELVPAIRELAARQTSLWLPVTLRDGPGESEDDDVDALQELAATLAAEGLARSWEDFLLAVGASRQLAATFSAASR